MGEWKFRVVQDFMEKNSKEQKEWERNFLEKGNDISTEKERLLL